MSFKSNAQREKFKKLVEDGKMTQEKFDEFEKNTGSAKIPEMIRGSKITAIKTTKLTKVIK